MDGVGYSGCLVPTFNGLKGTAERLRELYSEFGTVRVLTYEQMGIRDACLYALRDLKEILEGLREIPVTSVVDSPPSMQEAPVAARAEDAMTPPREEFRDEIGVMSDDEVVASSPLRKRARDDDIPSDVRAKRQRSNERARQRRQSPDPAKYGYDAHDPDDARRLNCLIDTVHHYELTHVLRVLNGMSTTKDTKAHDVIISDADRLRIRYGRYQKRDVIRDE